MIDHQWIDRLFSTIDGMDPAAFAAFLTPDGSFRWGSQDELCGREAITGFIGGFYGMLKSLRHSVTQVWEIENETRTLFVEGDVTYTLPDESTVTVPFLNRFLIEGDLIAEYFVFADPTPLYEALAKMQG